MSVPYLKTFKSFQIENETEPQILQYSSTGVATRAKRVGVHGTAVGTNDSLCRVQVSLVKLRRDERVTTIFFFSDNSTNTCIDISD